MPEPRRAAARARAWLGRCERRPRPARPSRAAARRRGPRARRGGAAQRRRGARRGRSRADPPRCEGGALAHQRHAVHGRDGRARARPRLATRANRRPRVRALARGAAGVADELPSRDPRGAAAPRPASIGGEHPSAARGLGDHRVASVVRQGAGRVFAAVRPAGARRGTRPDRVRRGDGRSGAQRRDRQPAGAGRRGPRRLERELPRPAARVRAGRARDGRVRAREHLGTARGAARQPVPVGRSAGVPDHRRRAQLGLHAAAVRGCLARLREQGALAPGECRLDPDKRRPGGSCVDGERRRPEGAAGARERRARPRDRAARRCPGDRVPRAARAGSRRPRDPRRSPGLVRAVAGRQVARRRHRAGGGGDP